MGANDGRTFDAGEVRVFELTMDNPEDQDELARRLRKPGERTGVTYGQLDKVLRSLGFSCRPAKQDAPGRVYEHKAGAMILLPDLPDSDQVFEHHLVAARLELDNFGLADPSMFAAKLQKAG